MTAGLMDDFPPTPDRPVRACSARSAFTASGSTSTRRPNWRLSGWDRRPRRSISIACAAGGAASTPSRSISCKRANSCPLRPLRERRHHLLNLTNGRVQFLSHTARHEATNRDLIVKPYRPYHRASGPVRFGDHGVVGNIDPIILKADSIMAVFGFPIGVCDAFTIRHRAAESFAARELIEPRFKR